MLYVMARYKKLMFSPIHEAVLKLEDHTFLHINDEILFEGAVVVEGAKSASVRIDWLDDVLGEICREICRERKP